MRLHFKAQIAAVITFVVTACSAPPSAGVIQTAIAQTVTANPGLFCPATSASSGVTSKIAFSATPIETRAPAYTPTFLPTFTPLPTQTPTATQTPTFTPKPPATQTAEALARRKTELSKAATTTQKVRSSILTATSVAMHAQATVLAKYKPISEKELASYPDQHVGEKVYFKGTVFNIVDSSTFQIYYGFHGEAIYVETRDSFRGLYENDFITVYGIVEGKRCFHNAYNAEICQPLIQAAFFE
jgi:hypothetical protein